jgi:hypothetical protein
MNDGIFRQRASPVSCLLDRRRDENSGAVAISVPGLKEAVNRLIDGFPIRTGRYGWSTTSRFIDL